MGQCQVVCGTGCQLLSFRVECAGVRQLIQLTSFHQEHILSTVADTEGWRFEPG